MSQPLYIQVANDLIKKIEAEVYQKKSILPTELKLGKQYSVSRVTIRQAIQILVEKEYVKKIQGSGTHVIFSKKFSTLNRSSKIISFSDEMKLLGKKTKVKILTFEMMKAPKPLAEELAINIGAAIFYYERILYGDDYPYCFEQGYMPIDKFSDLTINHLYKSKLDYIEKIKGIPIQYSHQIVHAILANETYSNALHVQLNSPLLDVTHITYQSNGIPIEKNSVIFDSNVYQAHFIKVRG